MSVSGQLVSPELSANSSVRVSERVKIVIERLARDQNEVDALAAAIGLSVRELFELKDKADRTVTLSQLLAERICQNELEKAAQCAYLAGFKTVAYDFLRILSPNQNEASLEEQIRNRFQLPDSLGDVSFETLLRIVRLSGVVQKLGIPENDDHSAQGLCRALFHWSETDACIRMRQLRDALCDLGHFEVVRDLVQVQEGAGRRGFSIGSPSTIFAHSAELIQVPKADKHFVGREESLEELQSALEEYRFVLLYGLPGIGKTSLAIAFAHAVRKQYRAIVFITCSSVHGLEHSLKVVRQKVAREVDSEHQTVRTSESELLEYMKHWLEQGGEILLIFDGLNDADSDFKSISNRIQALLDITVIRNPNIHCLFTSREKATNIGNLKFDASRIHEVEQLTSENVTKILIERCGAPERGKSESEEMKAVRWIAEEIEGVPQLADLVANVIKRKNYPFSLYRKYAMIKDSLLPDDTSQEAADKVRQFYRQIIEETAPMPLRPLRELLLVMAFSDHPKPVPLELFITGAEGLVEGCAMQAEYRKKKESLLDKDKVVTVTQVLFTDLLVKLQEAHLIHYDSKGNAWMHSESSKQVREIAEQEWENCRPEHGLAVLSSLLLTVYKADRTDKKGFYEALVSHTHTFIKIMNERGLQVNPDLLLQFGRMLSLLGSLQEAHDLLELCKESKKFEDDDFFRGLTFRHLGTVLRRLGSLPAAEALLCQAVEVWKGHLSVKGYSDQLNETQTALAEVLMDASEFQEAHRKMKIYKISSDLGTYYGNVGRALYGLGAYKESMRSFDNALNAFKNKNEYKRELFTIHRNLAEAAEAALTANSENFPDALDKCLEGEKRLISVHGPKHRYVAFAQREIARHQYEAAKAKPDTVDIVSGLESALEFAFKSLDGHVKVFGVEHQKVAKSSDVIAEVCSTLLGQNLHFDQIVVECERLALERAIENYKLIKYESFPAVEEIINNLSSRIRLRNFRQSYDDRNAGSSSRIRSAFRSSEVEVDEPPSFLPKEEEAGLCKLIKEVVKYYEAMKEHHKA